MSLPCPAAPRGDDPSGVVGFSTPEATIPWASPAFMAPVVEQVRLETGMPAAIAWGVGEPHAADKAIRQGQADLVKIGRALLANPHWPYEAARTLGVERPSWTTLPAPYAHWLESYRPVEVASLPADPVVTGMGHRSRDAIRGDGREVC